MTNIRSNDPAQPVTETTPIFRNIHISNVTATCTQDAGLIVGLPESVVSNVVLENVQHHRRNRADDCQRQRHPT